MFPFISSATEDPSSPWPELTRLSNPDPPNTSAVSLCRGSGPHEGKKVLDRKTVTYAAYVGEQAGPVEALLVRPLQHVRFEELFAVIMDQVEDPGSVFHADEFPKLREMAHRYAGFASLAQELTGGKKDLEDDKRMTQEWGRVVHSLTLQIVFQEAELSFIAAATNDPLMTTLAVSCRFAAL